MKRSLMVILAATGLLAAGCQVVPTDMFPKFTWYWSQDARDYRAEQTKYERMYEASTNRLDKP